MHPENILIVGASSGIGKQLAQHLLQETKVHLTLISRSRPEAAEQYPGRVDYTEFDILDGPLPDDVLPERLDGLVYCPGTITLKPFRSLKASDFMKDFEINVLGAVNTIQAALKPLKKSGNGSVVLFSTVAVGQGMPFHASIATAKAGIEGLTRSLAAELAPRIRVNCIAPSLTDTPLASRLLANDDRRDASAKRHPLNRVGNPKDIASAAAFLLSRQSAWVTGQIIGIDGGLSTLQLS